jgi:quinol monooxygenase YgiN
LIIVWGRVEAKPEHLQEVVRLGLEHVQRSRNEPGCLRHSAQVDVENSNALVFYEEWQDMGALQTHFSVPESGQFVAALTPLLDRAPEMKIFEANQTQ